MQHWRKAGYSNSVALQADMSSFQKATQLCSRHRPTEDARCGIHYNGSDICGIGTRLSNRSTRFFDRSCRYRVCCCVTGDSGISLLTGAMLRGEGQAGKDLATKSSGRPRRSDEEELRQAREDPAVRSYGRSEKI